MNLFLVAGTTLLVGGLIGVWGSVQSRRRGDPWRGNALASAAFTVYGGLVLTSPDYNSTVAGAVMMWTIAAAVWAGLWIARRERRMTLR